MISGIEARGFIFGPTIALAEEYTLEYGTDKMEMHVGAVKEGERTLIIDDLIATGRTLCAAIKLIERVRSSVACVIELAELQDV